MQNPLAKLVLDQAFSFPFSLKSLLLLFFRILLSLAISDGINLFGSPEHNSRTSTVETITSRQEMKSSILIPPFQISENWYATRTSTVLLVERPKPGTLTRDDEKIKARWIERDIFVLSGQGEPIRAEDDGRKGERRWEWELEG